MTILLFHPGDLDWGVVLIVGLMFVAILVAVSGIIFYLLYTLAKKMGGRIVRKKTGKAGNQANH